MNSSLSESNAREFFSRTHMDLLRTLMQLHTDFVLIQAVGIYQYQLEDGTEQILARSICPIIS